jgi:hypothetical protein
VLGSRLAEHADRVDRKAAADSALNVQQLCAAARLNTETPLNMQSSQQQAATAFVTVQMLLLGG